MKLRIALVLLGMTFLASGCRLHPPYGILNDNTSFIPPLSKLTHRNNLPPANMLMEPGPGVGGPGPGILTPPAMGAMGGPGGMMGGPGWAAVSSLAVPAVLVAPVGPAALAVPVDRGWAG